MNEINKYNVTVICLTAIVMTTIVSGLYVFSQPVSFKGDITLEGDAHYFPGSGNSRNIGNSTNSTSPGIGTNATTGITVTRVSVNGEGHAPLLAQILLSEVASTHVSSPVTELPFTTPAAPSPQPDFSLINFLVLVAVLVLVWLVFGYANQKFNIQNQLNQFFFNKLDLFIKNHPELEDPEDKIRNKLIGIAVLITVATGIVFEPRPTFPESIMIVSPLLALLLIYLCSINARMNRISYMVEASDSK